MLKDLENVDQLVSDLVADLKMSIGEAQIARLRAELPGLYHNSQIYRTKGAAGAPSKRITEFKRIRNSCRVLREALAVKDPAIDGRDLMSLVKAHPSISILAFDLSSHLDPDERRDLPIAGNSGLQAWWNDLFDKLDTLETLTDKAASDLASRKKPGWGGARHKSDWARQETAWHLLRLYSEVTEKAPGVSNPPSGGDADGPAVRFLTRCLETFGWSMTPNAAAKLIRDTKLDD